jgi:hypothetical protein
VYVDGQNQAHVQTVCESTKCSTLTQLHAETRISLSTGKLYLSGFYLRYSLKNSILPTKNSLDYSVGYTHKLSTRALPAGLLQTHQRRDCYRLKMLRLPDAPVSAPVQLQHPLNGAEPPLWPHNPLRHYFVVWIGLSVPVLRPTLKKQAKIESW